MKQFMFQKHMIHKASTPGINKSSLTAALAVLLAVLLGAAGARAQTCPLYPIALSLQSLTNAAPGTTLTNIWNGSQPGNFGWLSWTGDPGETTLVVSLTPPGDSSTYVNPDNSSDTNLVVGKWVSGKPGVSNGKFVRNALDTLIGAVITVPVWDTARGQGDNTAYHVVGFADVELISYHLPSQNQITATFLGFSSCGGGGVN
jgi:hypothetical protein